MSEDDELHDFDLSAWEAPPPPDGLADGVVARVAGTDVGAVVPVEPREPRRRWVFAVAAAAALVLVVGAYALVRSAHHTEPTFGTVVAARARHLDLETVSADLEQGATVTWRRDRDGIAVDQRGTARWTVEGEDQLRIDAGATGASVEATGASLRVEVPMNMMDAKIIGASVVTATAVAALTVVVYEGHVKVSSGGQTVVVQPGSTYTVAPPLPPQPEPPVAVGVAPPDDNAPPHGKRLVAVLGLEVVGARAQKDADFSQITQFANDLTNGLRARAKSGTGPFQMAAGSDKQLLDEKLLHNCDNEAVACMAAIGDDLGADVMIYGRVEAVGSGYGVTLKLLDVKRKLLAKSSVNTIPVDEAAGVALQVWAKKMYAALAGIPDPPSGSYRQALDAIKGDVAACFHVDDPEDVITELTIDPSGKVEHVQVNAVRPGEETSAELSTCLSDAIRKAQFPTAADRVKISFPIRRPAKTASSCDADALKQKGSEATALGQHAVALASFEAALACKSDPQLVQLAYMAACNSRNVAKARTYYAQIPSNRQPALAQLCIRNGITAEQLRVPACDAEALQQKGEDQNSLGQYPAALVTFEQALGCSSDPHLLELAFMASCNARNIPKARAYYGRLSASKQGKLAQICIRNGVTLDHLER